MKTNEIKLTALWDSFLKGFYEADNLVSFMFLKLGVIMSAQNQWLGIATKNGNFLLKEGEIYFFVDGNGDYLRLSTAGEYAFLLGKVDGLVAAPFPTRIPTQEAEILSERLESLSQGGFIEGITFRQAAGIIQRATGNDVCINPYDDASIEDAGQQFGSNSGNCPSIYPLEEGGFSYVTLSGREISIWSTIGVAWGIDCSEWWAGSSRFSGQILDAAEFVLCRHEFEDSSLPESEPEEVFSGGLRVTEKNVHGSFYEARYYIEDGELFMDSDCELFPCNRKIVQLPKRIGIAEQWEAEIRGFTAEGELILQDEDGLYIRHNEESGANTRWLTPAVDARSTDIVIGCDQFWQVTTKQTETGDINPYNLLYFDFDPTGLISKGEDYEGNLKRYPSGVWVVTAKPE